jgi:predicted RNase H-like nuclease (RuvC/YqgF family)
MKGKKLSKHVSDGGHCTTQCIKLYKFYYDSVIVDYDDFVKFRTLVNNLEANNFNLQKENDKLQQDTNNLNVRISQLKEELTKTKIQLQTQQNQKNG